MHHRSTFLAGGAALLAISLGCNSAGPPMPAAHPTAQPSSPQTVQPYGQSQSYGAQPSAPAGDAYGGSMPSGDASPSGDPYGGDASSLDASPQPSGSQAPGMSPQQSMPAEGP